MIDEQLLGIITSNPNDANNLVNTLLQVPVYVAPVVTVGDAKNGYLQRYFTYPLNEPLNITEVNNEQYTKLVKNFRFATTSVEWKIVGKKESYKTPFGVQVLGVEDFNKQQVKQADLTFKNLHKYITDYTQYWLGETI